MSGWMIGGGIVGLLIAGWIWWMWYNAALTMPRFSRRHGNAGAGVAPAPPAIPGWLRSWLLRVLVVFGILALMAGINFLSNFLFGYGLGDVGDWIDDLLGRAGAKTLAKTLWQPLPLLLIATGAAILALIFHHKKAATVIVIATLGLTVYHYFVPTKCWSKDTVCIAAQQKVADAKVAEELKKEQQQQAAIEQARIATQQKAAEAAGGAQCLNVVHKDHVFGLQPDETSLVNNEGRCFFYFEPPPGTCFYAQGRWSDERKGPFGTCPTAIPFNATNAPRDPVRVWSAGPTPFTADYVLRPRTGTHGTVN